MCDRMLKNIVGLVCWRWDVVEVRVRLDTEVVAGARNTDNSEALSIRNIMPQLTSARQYLCFYCIQA